MVIVWTTKLVLCLIFLGYLIIWVLSPTKRWCEKWLLEFFARTDTKSFGWQGVYMLIYSLPVLLIAVFGCFYLHLRKKYGENYRIKAAGNNRASWMSRPMLVKGPLGVVSAVELLCFFMFLAVLLWCLSTYLANNFRQIEKGILVVSDEGRKPDGRKWVQKLRIVGLYLGVVGNISCSFLFFPVTRGSSILPLVGLTSEGSIKYHIWVGHITMVFFTAHGLVFLLYWAITNNLMELLKWDNVGISNVAGEISLLFGLALWITVIPRLRRKMFELFFYTHQLYALFMFFFLLHAGVSGTFTVVLPGFYLFLIDRYLRFLQSRQKVRLVSARVLPCETLELNFSKSRGLNYNPASVVFINVPSISSLQWHPFTVSSNSNLEPDVLSVLIKKEGKWTGKLYETLASPCPVNRLEASLEGPYGPISADFLRYDSLVMVAGGSGIAPLISIIRELFFRKASLNCSIPRIFLLCAFKRAADLTMLDLILPINTTGVPTDIDRVVLEQLEIQAFVTRETGPSAPGRGNQVRTIWLKPNPTDEPISPVLGPRYAWLWLGAIISSSFVLFLIVMGIIGRYYIYPIDKNTYEVYSTSSKAVLNMLVLCSVTMGIATIATLWNKRQNAREGKQIQNTPTSWDHSDVGDRELGSFPQQFCNLAQNTKFHFGSRPDIKKMLMEYKGSSSTGVLVSGPAEMRHEVAALCSSSDGENLHYEAISFNW